MAFLVQQLFNGDSGAPVYSIPWSSLVLICFYTCRWFGRCSRCCMSSICQSAVVLHGRGGGGGGGGLWLCEGRWQSKIFWQGSVSRLLAAIISLYILMRSRSHWWSGEDDRWMVWDPLNQIIKINIARTWVSSSRWTVVSLTRERLSFVLGMFIHCLVLLFLSRAKSGLWKFKNKIA